MTCADFEPCLDGIIDDTLSSDQLTAMQAHAVTCPHCAEQLRLTRQMKAVFDDMLPEVDVPLEVQAGWRRAVKDERRGRWRWVRFAASAAAVLIALVGVTFMMPQRTSQISAVKSADVDAYLMNASKSSVFEADGMMASEEAAVAQADGGPMREVQLTVEDLDAAIVHIADLALEYEGSMDEQRFESEGQPCANLYIDLPSANLSDFLSAAAYLDVGGVPDGEVSAEGEGDTALLLVLRTA